jgi:hypothetical protein
MSEKQYYCLLGDVQTGPFTLSELRRMPLHPDTQIWNVTLPEWTKAGELPELYTLFGKTPPPPPSRQPASGHHGYGPAFRPPMPDSYMVWAILTLVFCCWIISIFAIVESAKVSSLYHAGDYAGAQRASASARKYATWSAASAAIVIGLYLLFILGVTIIGALSNA